MHLSPVAQLPTDQDPGGSVSGAAVGGGRQAHAGCGCRPERHSAV